MVGLLGDWTHKGKRWFASAHLLKENGCLVIAVTDGENRREMPLPADASYKLYLYLKEQFENEAID